MAKSDPMYRKASIFLLKHSNSIAVIMMIVTLFVCFSQNSWLYVICLLISSVYLAILTGQYIISENEEEQGCNMQQGCQVTSFNSRLSILSNVSISFFGIAFALMTSYYLIYPPVDAVKIDYFDIGENSFIIGCFKLMFIYIISDKIHSLQFLFSILFRYSHTIRFLNITKSCDTEARFPLIYVNKEKISPKRYYVIDKGDKIVNVVFDPPLSINDNTSIEYGFIEEDDDHVIHNKSPYDIYTQPSCFFRCHVVVKDINSN